jgi:hypothetical protein
MAMGRWLLGAALLAAAPLTVCGGAEANPPPAERPVETAYAVGAPAAHDRSIAEGWGLYATLHGRSMDIASRDWAEDPHVQPHDVEAGYGWRDGATTALIGYDQHDYGPRFQQTIPHRQRNPNDPPPVNSPGVLGFSLVLHGR